MIWWEKVTFVSVYQLNIPVMLSSANVCQKNSFSGYACFTNYIVLDLTEQYSFQSSFLFSYPDKMDSRWRCLFHVSPAWLVAVHGARLTLLQAATLSAKLR